MMIRIAVAKDEVPVHGKEFPAMFGHERYSLKDEIDLLLVHPIREGQSTVTWSKYLDNRSNQREERTEIR